LYYFSFFGKVDKVSILKDKNSGRTRGFGFVCFENEQSIDYVLNYPQHIIQGKRVECKRSIPKESDKKELTSSPYHFDSINKSMINDNNTSKLNPIPTNRNMENSSFQPPLLNQNVQQTNPNPQQQVLQTNHQLEVNINQQKGQYQGSNYNNPPSVIQNNFCKCI
jgi:RNA recognition motif-containing protein